jgi:hypothetical protein
MVIPLDRGGIFLGGAGLSQTCLRRLWDKVAEPKNRGRKPPKGVFLIYDIGFMI